MTARLATAAAIAAAVLSNASVDVAFAQNHPENDPKNCRQHWEAIGLPEQKGAGTVQIIHVCHLGYVVGQLQGHAEQASVKVKLLLGRGQGLLGCRDLPVHALPLSAEGIGRHVAALLGVEP